MTPNQKSSSYHFNPSCRAQVLRNEIAWIELEIMHLERHLISLYKNAHQQPQKQHKKLHSRTPDLCISLKSYGSEIGSGDAASSSLQASPMNLKVSGEQLVRLPYVVKEKKDVVTRNRVSHSHSLADHLSTSSSPNTSIPPDQLSEDIVKCISSIYYKLANPVSDKHTQIGIGAGSSNSSSSSSSYSSFISSSSSRLYSGFVYNDEDKWSPRSKPRRPYCGAVQVSNISSVDNDDTFQYAAKMLEKFRSLVKSLEKVDPRKMNREEKLAFWINIHNSLAMHAHLAYGTRDRVKSSSFFKATYNVGGHCINAHIIQSSILGIHSHYSLPWLQFLLSPRNKFKTENMKHIYAIDYPEPLVHFALCSGAYSDPAVRVYRAKNVFDDLNLAMEEFAYAGIHVLNETKLVLPKIFSYYAKDISLDVSGLLKVVYECLPEEVEAVTKCLNDGSAPHDKRIHWLSQSSTFRYLIHKQLAQQIVTSL